MGAVLFSAVASGFYLVLGALPDSIMSQLPVWLYRSALFAVLLAGGLGAMTGAVINGAWLDLLARPLGRIALMPFLLPIPRWCFLVAMSCLALLVLSEWSETLLWVILGARSDEVAAVHWHYVGAWNVIVAVYTVGIGLLVAFFVLWIRHCVRWLVGGHRVVPSHGPPA